MRRNHYELATSLPSEGRFITKSKRTEVKLLFPLCALIATVSGETEEVQDKNKVGHKWLPSFKKAPIVLCARFLVFSETNGFFFFFCLEIARKIPKNIRGI